MEPLSTAYKTVCMQMTKATWLKRPVSVVIDSATYVSAHDQFARHQQCSNEPLRHH